MTSVQRPYTTVHCWDRQQIYTAIVSRSYEHCGQPRYNHAKQNNNKTNTKTENKETAMFNSFITIFILHLLQPPHPLPHSSPSSVVRLGSAFVHTPIMTDEQTKKQEIEKKVELKNSYNTVYNKSSSFLSSTLLKEDNAGCITAHSDN